MRGVEALQQFAQTLRLPEKTIHGLALALEESASNIVNHALQHDVHKTFHLAMERTDDNFLVELRDGGPKFDPTLVTTRKSPADDDELPGGWGIQLVRRYTDEIHYTREGSENVLRLIKRVSLSADEKELRNIPKPSTDH